MIHALKYHSDTDMAVILGQKAADYYRNLHPNFQPEVIIPVPLHFSKKLKRGYNQSTFIANGMSAIWSAIVDEDIVIRKIQTSSQTKKSRTQRVQNMQNVFEVKKQDIIKSKHILIVDDVITTGATIGALCETIIPFQPKSIHILCLALKT